MPHSGSIGNQAKSGIYFLSVTKDITELKKQIQEIPEVSNVHDIHLWPLDGEKDIFTVHVKVEKVDDFNKQSAVKAAIRQILAENHIKHITIEVESIEEDCEQVDC